MADGRVRSGYKTTGMGVLKKLLESYGTKVTVVTCTGVRVFSFEQKYTRLYARVLLCTSVGGCQADHEGYRNEWDSEGFGEGSSWWSEEPTDGTGGGEEERDRRMTLSETERQYSAAAEETKLPPN